ncbi:MAG: hypothetical protein HY320_07750 [Armatimonadetes bacterium]|nr:hypothetical protein [Armatimonadota bacterium]
MSERAPNERGEEWRQFRAPGRGARRFWLRLAGFAGGALLWTSAGWAVGAAGWLIPAGLPAGIQPVLILAGGLAGSILGDCGPWNRARAPEGVPVMLLLAVAGAAINATFLEIMHAPLTPYLRRSTLGIGFPKLAAECAWRALLCAPLVAHAVIHTVGACLLLAPLAVILGWGYNACEGLLREE